MGHFLTRGFRRPREAVEANLGALERQVLEELWATPATASVRALRAALGDRLAYTTVMTTADRLFKKGLVGRRREGRAFLYWPLRSREQLRNDVTADVIGGLLGENAASARPVLSTLLDAIEARDALLLDELEALIEEKRRSKREPHR